MDEKTVRRALTRIAHEIIERNKGAEMQGTSPLLLLHFLLRFFCFTFRFFDRPIAWVDFGVIRRRLGQDADVMNVADVSLVIREFVIVVHLDRVEWTKLGAVAAIHTHVNVNVKFGGLGLRLAFGRRRAHNPDALRRTHLGTNAARGTFLPANRFLARLGINDRLAICIKRGFVH